MEVGELVKDFKPGDKVIVPAITPDWNSLEAQGGYSMHSHGMLNGWKFSNVKDGLFGEFFHVNDPDGNLALLPENIKKHISHLRQNTEQAKDQCVKTRFVDECPFASHVA